MQCLLDQCLRNTARSAQQYCYVTGVQEGAYPPHAMTTVSPMIARDSQYEGKVSTLSGVAAVLVCNAAHTAQRQTPGIRQHEVSASGDTTKPRHSTFIEHAVQIPHVLDATSCFTA